MNSYASTPEQITLCGTNQEKFPTSAIVLSLDFSGNIKWYNSFETTQRDRVFGNSRCRGVAYDDNNRIAAVVEMETEARTNVYDVYVLSIKDDNTVTGVNIQAKNFNENPYIAN